MLLFLCLCAWACVRGLGAKRKVALASAFGESDSDDEPESEPMKHNTVRGQFWHLSHRQLSLAESVVYMISHHLATSHHRATRHTALVMGDCVSHARPLSG